jgi:[protein-PII] uridylyltransferase
VLKHLALVSKARTGVAADVTQEDGPQVQVTVVGDDEPGFLANVCAAFNYAHFKVVSAQIHSWRETDGRPRAVDSFWVTTGNQEGKVWEALQRFERTLRDVVSKKVVALELVQAVGNSQKYSMRPAPAVPIQVRVDNQEATDRTIVEVITQDRVGLLFWIAETIFECGLSIDLAKIHTEGARVTDVFYVTTSERKKLLDEDRIEELRERLLQRLYQLEGKTYSGVSAATA